MTMEVVIVWVLGVEYQDNTTEKSILSVTFYNARFWYIISPTIFTFFFLDCFRVV